MEALFRANTPKKFFFSHEKQVWLWKMTIFVCARGGDNRGFHNKTQKSHQNQLFSQWQTSYWPTPQHNFFFSHEKQVWLCKMTIFVSAPLLSPMASSEKSPRGPLVVCEVSMNSLAPKYPTDLYGGGILDPWGPQSFFLGVFIFA